MPRWTPAQQTKQMDEGSPTRYQPREVVVEGVPLSWCQLLSPSGEDVCMWVERMLAGESGRTRM